MAEVLTCPEDKLSKCPTEILEEIFQYNRLEVLFWSTIRCVMLEETKVLVQVHGEAAVLERWSGLLEK